MILFKELFPEVNIGTVGHVDHGKTSLVNSLTGKWADTHSEETKRGITIRIGYADATFYYCKKDKKYTNTPKCSSCFSDCEPKRAVSFIDAPGHETLMATVLSGTALMNGAIILISATEKCPKPQTAEHLNALNIAGIKNIVVVQNKIDLVSEERAKESYEEIKEFIKGTVAEDAPIIPISAVHGINIDLVIEAIENVIKTPKNDNKKNLVFYVARSFDINKPGTEIEKITGGVVGGSVISGEIKVGDTIEIKPGVPSKNSWEPLKASVSNIIRSGKPVKSSGPGGLISVQTMLDPSITKGDNLAGNILGIENELPKTKNEIKFESNLFEKIVGVDKIDDLRQNDILMITVGVSKTAGSVISKTPKEVKVNVRIPVIAEKNERISLSKQINGRWHLIGYGIVK